LAPIVTASDRSGVPKTKGVARALKNQLMRGLLFETRNGHLAVKPPTSKFFSKSYHSSANFAVYRPYHPLGKAKNSHKNRPLLFAEFGGRFFRRLPLPLLPESAPLSILLAKVSASVSRPGAKKSHFAGLSRFTAPNPIH
jgi:hypothetical protein